MSLYQGTNMPELKEPGDTVAVRKGVLDLLKKINEVWDSLFPNAVYDTGTNTFGSWIRYNNGVMQCWGSKAWTGSILTNNFSGPFTVTLPQSFVDASYNFNAWSEGTGGGYVQFAYNYNAGASKSPSSITTGGLLSVYSAGTITANATSLIAWTAIGKWK